MVLEQSNYKQVKESLDSCLKKESRGGFLYVFLGNLSLIMSGYGEDYSESLVSNLIKQLDEKFGENIFIFRVDREHLNIIVNSIDKEGIEKVASKINRAIRNYSSNDSTVPVQFYSTIGAIAFSDSSSSSEEIINSAYISLVEAQENLVNFSYCSDKEKSRSDAKKKLISANYLQNAFLKNKLRFAYQPVVKASTGEVEYYECLLRIINEKKELVSAGPFIPTAEKMGMIDMIDDFVLVGAVEQLKNNKELTLSINVSNSTIQNSKWLDIAKELLSNNDLSSRLIVEITETFEQNNVQKIENFIESLHDLGCRVALDDFGTGYTSFNQLKNFAFDIIKIDGSFVRDLVSNDKNRFIVKAVLDYSNNFGISTVAEFVEDEATASILKDMKVDLMQGYYFSPAISSPSWNSKASKDVC